MPGVRQIGAPVWGYSPGAGGVCGFQPMILRPFQSDLLGSIREAWPVTPRVCLQSPTGSGKTVIFTHLAETEPGRVLIIAHRSEILDQISATLTEPHGSIRAGMPESDHRIQVASIHTLVRRTLRPPDVIIVDECFPAGTLVGGMPIQNIVPGDHVIGYSDGRPVIETVVRVMKRRPTALVTVKTSRGAPITCTPEHPFYTITRGWVPAKTLTSRDVVVSISCDEEMCDLRRPGNEQVVWKSEMQIGAIKTKHQRVPIEIRKFNQVPKNKRNEPSRGTSKSVNAASCDVVETSDTGWEWESAHASADAYGVCFGVGYGSSGPHQARPTVWVSDELQIGYCQRGAADRGRSGWVFSRDTFSESPRPEERLVVTLVGVVGVTVHKQTGGDGFDGLCPDGFVYNLETTGSHTYTANGIVVHNCHHAAAPSFRNVLGRFPDARVLGVTATPERLDGKGLGEVFQKLIRGPTTADLIGQNLLKRPIYYAPARTVDVSAVKKAMGDFSTPDLVRVMDTSVLVGDAVAHYQRLGRGAPALGFGVNLDHARHMAAAFTAAGIPAEVIEGSLDAPARREMKARLVSGETRAIMSCELVSEGFDMPAVGCVLLCRPTMSLGLHLQQIGRALRGSGEAVILDHAGNCLRHGLAEEPREWSLEGRARQKRDKEAELETRQCKECFAIFLGTTCPQCGTVRLSRKRELEIAAEELQRIEEARVKPLGKCVSLMDFQRLGKQRGYKPGWAWFQHQSYLRKKLKIA